MFCGFCGWNKCAFSQAHRAEVYICTLSARFRKGLRLYGLAQQAIH